MFVDRVKLFVKAGDGGRGCVSFRREPHVPRGGPDGGSGGRGGDVVLLAVSHQNTLLPLRYHTEFRAERGRHGGPGNRTGRRGSELVIPVPPGTEAHAAEGGESLGEVLSDGDRLVVARGGRGGRGNQAFLSNRNRAPREAEPGTPGEELWLRLDLRLIADVGLLGLPNAGKSTLIAKVSSARPKVADYPFTTLVPNLGVIRGPDYRDVVVADLPGIIEGAHEGKGLGDQFLKHIERTRLIVHLVDCSPEAMKPPAEAYAVIRKELESHSPVLAAKPEIVVATKMDVTGAPKAAKVLQKKLKRDAMSCISAATGEGVASLVRELFRALHSPDGIK